MKLEIKALAPFTAFTGEMVVLAPGDTAFLPEKMALDYIDAGLATNVAKEKKPASPAKDKKPGALVEKGEAEQGAAPSKAADAPPAA